MLEIRPDLQSAYDSICYEGLQFPDQHPIIQLKDLSFEHRRKGSVPIKIDAGVLAMQGSVYAGDPALRAALEDHGIVSQSWEDAKYLLGQHLDPENEALVWAFSGYATAGIDESTGKPFGYTGEANGLRWLYNYLLAEDKAPSLVIDGGVSQGFLALSSVVARSAGIPTLGFAPRQGLASVGVRDHMVIAGDTYIDRQTLVGTADVMVCAGGAEGTEQECAYALSRGATVLLLQFVDYPPHSFSKTFRENQDIREAHDEGRLVVCKTYDAIPESVELILQTDIFSGRTERNQVVTDFLS